MDRYNTLLEAIERKEAKKFSLREEFAANLNDYSRMYGKTQADLCEETGIPKSTMSQYFSGARYPRPSQLEAIAECFNITVAQLVGDASPDAERVQDLPMELRIIARRGLRLSPSERASLLRYCMFMYPDAFRAGEDDEDDSDIDS